MSEKDRIVQEFIKDGTAVYNMGHYDNLARLCEEFLKTMESDGVYALLCLAQLALGDTGAAEKSARRGLSLNPDSADNMINLAYILGEKGAYSNALRYFVRARKFLAGEAAEACGKEISNLESITGKTADELMPGKAARRALIIAAIYPPMGGSGVQRTVKLVKYLRLFGWEPVVVTLYRKDRPLNSGFEYFDELPDGIDVVRIPDRTRVSSYEINNMKDKLTAMLSPETKAEFEVYYNGNNLQSKAELCGFPEGVVSWAYYVAENIGEHVDMNGIDLVYSTSGPFSDHFAGYYIKRRYDKPWVADFRDEWSNNPGIWPDKDTLEYRMCLDCERIILNAADRVICVTEKSFENYVALGVPENKLTCITNGFDEEDFEGIPDNGQYNDKFTMVHNGVLYFDRTPYTMFKAVKNLIDRGEIDDSRIVFHLGYYGTSAENGAARVSIVESGLERVVFVTPYTEHSESLALMMSADLLILVLGPSETYNATYPAKIFEYLRAGKPVLSLGPEGSVIQSLLERTGHGINVDFSNVTAIETEVLKHYNAWLKKSSGTVPERADVSKFERRCLTERHAEVFNDAVLHNHMYKTLDKRDFRALIERGDFGRADAVLGDAALGGRIQRTADLAETWLESGAVVPGKVYFRYGRSLNALGRYDEAADAHKKAIKIMPELSNIKHGDAPTDAVEYDEYESGCIGCGSVDTETVFVCNQSQSGNNYGVLNPIRIWNRCNACGLVFAGNMPSPAALGRYYAEHFKDVQPGGANYSIGEMGNLRNYIEYSNNRLERIEIIVGKKGTLLDIGAGLATFVKTALERGWNAQGLESSPNNLEYVKGKWGIELISDDFFDFAPQHKYDVITMFEVIEHLIKPWEALDRCAGMLSEGGLLVIATPFRDSDFVKVKERENDFWWYEPAHLTYMDMETLIKRAKSAGLRCVKISDSEQKKGRLEVYLRKE